MLECALPQHCAPAQTLLFVQLQESGLNCNVLHPGVTALTTGGLQQKQHALVEHTDN